MSLTNTAKPSEGTLENLARVSDGELWSTIESTWASETRTWAQMSSELTDTDRPRTLGSYTFDELGGTPIEEIGGAMDDSSFMQNTARPND